MPRPQGPACDSGAYELAQPLRVTITSGPSGTITTSNVSFAFTADEPSTFQCKLDGGSFAPCTSPFNAGPLALGTHTFTVKATDPADLLITEASRTFTIAATGAGGNGSSGGLGGAGGLGGGGSGVRPVVSGLTQSATRWREGSALARISRASAKPPRGTAFSFTLNEAATVKLAFTQPATGRRVGGRCVSQTKHNRTKHACRRTLTLGVITLAGHAGADRVRFEGLLSTRKKLKPGRYTLQLSASDGGLTSSAHSLTFTILKG